MPVNYNYSRNSLLCLNSSAIAQARPGAGRHLRAGPLTTSPIVHRGARSLRSPVRQTRGSSDRSSRRSFATRI